MRVLLMIIIIQTNKKKFWICNHQHYKTQKKLQMKAFNSILNKMMMRIFLIIKVKFNLTLVEILIIVMKALAVTMKMINNINKAFSQ